MNTLPQSSLRQLETKIGEALLRFETEYMGRQPLAARVHLLNDMIVVRLEGVLIPSEANLAQSDDGRQLVKNIRCKFIEMGRPLLEANIRDILGVEVQSLHTDLSTRTGERLIAFRLKEPLPDVEGRAAFMRNQEHAAVASVR